MIFIVCYLAVLFVVIGGMWMTFSKARQPGWACIIPIYNIYVMTQIAGKPGWWTLLFFIPLVNVIIAIMVLHGISTNFGRGVGTTLGLIFLPFIFYPILGWGDAKYQA